MTSRIFLAAAAVAVLTLSACADDGDDTTAAPPATATTENGAPATAEEGAASEHSAADDAPPHQEVRLIFRQENVIVTVQYQQWPLAGAEGPSDGGLQRFAHMVAQGLADRLNIPRKEGEEFVSRYLERFPAVRAFREQVIERAQEEGFVTTLMGRRRPIPELRSGNPNTRRLGERLAVNTVIQGTAADIIKVAMVRCQRALKETGGETRLVLQIHDELLFEGPEAEMDRAQEIAVREMRDAFELDPPLEVNAGVGPDWLSVK